MVSLKNIRDSGYDSFSELLVGNGLTVDHFRAQELSRNPDKETLIDKLYNLKSQTSDYIESISDKTSIAIGSTIATGAVLAMLGTGYMFNVQREALDSRLENLNNHISAMNLGDSREQKTPILPKLSTSVYNIDLDGVSQNWSYEQYSHKAGGEFKNSQNYSISGLKFLETFGNGNKLFIDDFKKATSIYSRVYSQTMSYGGGTIPSANKNSILSPIEFKIKYLQTLAKKQK